jgi:TFIIF, beta subunit HTH domain
MSWGSGRGDGVSLSSANSRFNDLQKLLNQPAGVLKDVLSEVAVYCTEPPHKFEYELKPQYRYYAPRYVSS